MQVLWSDLTRYYGRQFLGPFETNLKVPGMETNAVLACRWSPSIDVRFRNISGDHAEDRLLADPIWTQDIPRAIESWSDLNPAPVITTLAINRSPCGRCAQRLAGALNELRGRYPLRTDKQHFLLAIRGYYQNRNFMMADGTTDKTKVTTIADLKLLEDSGWKLCVLLFDDEPTRMDQSRRGMLRQRGLLEALAHMRNARRA